MTPNRCGNEDREITQRREVLSLSPGERAGVGKRKSNSTEYVKKLVFRA